jgi:hypothetical protein
LDGPAASAILRDAAAGKVGGPLCRGRSTWSRPGQAAELVLRGEVREFGPDAVAVLAERQLEPVPDGPDRRYEVTLDVGGVRYRAVLAESAAAEPRPESCGKPFGKPLELRLVSLEKDG